jgi:hypothetical protein
MLKVGGWIKTNKTEIKSDTMTKKSMLIIVFDRDIRGDNNYTVEYTYGNLVAEDPEASENRSEIFQSI